MSRGPSIRLVCFDLGGVLVRICRSWREGCALAGLPVHEGWDEEAAVLRRRRAYALLQTGRITTDDYLAEVAASCERRYTDEDIRRVHDSWLLGEYPGVDRVVARLVDRGRATGILSNTDVRHWTRMTGGGDFPTLRRIVHRHASHLLGLAKPDAEIYRAFEERSGFAGQEILFFDDLEANVAGARERGWTAERVDPHGDTAVQMTEILERLELI